MTAPLIVVGGVAGCGKTTLAAALAQALGISFRDGDDLHPEANKAKMAAGEPLTDADRAPWLAACAAQLAEWGDAGGVISASALKRAYRDTPPTNLPFVWTRHGPPISRWPRCRGFCGSAARPCVDSGAAARRGQRVALGFPF
jgi:carbohydrate kinase (thermoresistant glucokinase family)